MDIGGIIGFIVGLAFFVLVGIPVMGAVLTVAFGAVVMTWALIGAMLLYSLGIPLAIAYRIKYGYWA